MVARIAIIVGALSFAGIVRLVVQQGQVSELAAAVSTLPWEASRARGALAARVVPLEADPGVSDQFRTAVREEQGRLDDESRSRWQTSLEEARRESLEELAKKVHLSSLQEQLLYDLLGTEHERMLEAFRRVREDGLPMADARAQVELIRRATDEEVHAELDDDQFSGYEEMRPVYRVGGPLQDGAER